MNVPGIEIAGQARFNPTQYLAALLARIHGGGSHVFEETNVDEVNGGRTSDNALSLIAGFHTITCDYVIIATHNPIVGHAGLLSASLLQTKLALYTSYAVSGRVPSGSIPDALFWDTSDPYNYMRLERQPGRRRPPRGCGRSTAAPITRPARRMTRARASSRSKPDLKRARPRSGDHASLVGPGDRNERWIAVHR